MDFRPVFGQISVFGGGFSRRNRFVIEDWKPLINCVIMAGLLDLRQIGIFLLAEWPPRAECFMTFRLIHHQTPILKLRLTSRKVKNLIFYPSKGSFFPSSCASKTNQFQSTPNRVSNSTANPTKSPIRKQIKSIPSQQNQNEVQQAIDTIRSKVKIKSQKQNNESVKMNNHLAVQCLISINKSHFQVLIKYLYRVSVCKFKLTCNVGSFSFSFIYWVAQTHTLTHTHTSSQPHTQIRQRTKSQS